MFLHYPMFQLNLMNQKFLHYPKFQKFLMNPMYQ
jgi:hypothetical protein